MKGSLISAQEIRRLWRGQSRKPRCYHLWAPPWHPEDGLGVAQRRLDFTFSHYIPPAGGEPPHLLPHTVLDLLILPGVVRVLAPQPAQRPQGLVILPLGEQEPGRVGHEAEQDDHREHGHLPCDSQPAPVQDQPCQSSTVRRGLLALFPHGHPNRRDLINPEGKKKKKIPQRLEGRFPSFSPSKEAFSAVVQCGEIPASSPKS